MKDLILDKHCFKKKAKKKYIISESFLKRNEKYASFWGYYLLEDFFLFSFCDSGENDLKIIRFIIFYS